MRRKLALLALFLCAAVCAGARPRPVKFFEAVEPHMGTLVGIKLYATSEDTAKLAFRAAFDRIAQLDRILSDYQPDSELNQVCRTAVTQPVKVSYDLFRVLAASQQLAEESNGAFDITLGPVIHLWRQARQSAVLPEAAALREAGARCGFAKLHLDAIGQTVKLDQNDMALDVGGIAKGYAADAALEVLRRFGVHSALVAASGDLAFSDAPPGQRGWKIGIGALDQPDASSARTLELRNAAVSTSGDSEQHLDVAGKRYSHIIDPATFMGLTSGIVVSVVAPRGITADGLATAICVLGSDRGIALAKRHSGIAVFIASPAGGQVSFDERNGGL
jgi:FAD:protein FMN transferase